MSLSEPFIATAPEPLRNALIQVADLDQRLWRLFEEAQATWPGVSLDPAAYVAHVASHLPEQEGVEALDKLATTDLYLACACARGDPEAIRTFHATYGDALRAVIGRSAPAAVDDIAQRLVARLLTGEAPSIRTYAGRSSLRSWLRVVATRAVYAHAKRERKHEGDDLEAIAERLDTGTDDPELERLKKTYRAEFKRGFARAFEKLTVRERNLLRHEHLDGLGVNDLAELYGVHRATVTRWRNDAREKLLRETRRYFRDVVAVGADDFKSIMRLIDSQLDVSLSRLLRQDGAED